MPRFHVEVGIWLDAEEISTTCLMLTDYFIAEAVMVQGVGL